MPSQETQPLRVFHDAHYVRFNKRRLEHLASLRLPWEGKSVLEVGAGIGDLTSFFLDRGCSVTAVDARLDNLDVLRQRYRGSAGLSAEILDLDDPPDWSGRRFDVVFCYGLLYHLIRPAEAIRFMAGRARETLLIETVVSMGAGEEVPLVDEGVTRCSQSMRGQGCRPTRAWVMARLREHFPHACTPRTQPRHEDFQIEWTDVPSDRMYLGRAVFLGTRAPLDEARFSAELLAEQTRH